MAEEPRDSGKVAPADDKDRRHGTRLPLEMWVEEISEGSQVFRRAGNLSHGGMYLDQTIPLPIGSHVRLRFTLPGDSVPISLTAEIVSISSKDVLGMGCKFVEIDGDGQALIDAYLARAAG